MNDRELASNVHQAHPDAEVEHMLNVERLSLRRDRVRRKAALSPRGVYLPNQGAVFDWNVRGIISPQAAGQALGVSGQLVSKLARAGVIRKAHPDYWGGYLLEDVAELAKHQYGTPEWDETVSALRLANLNEYFEGFISKDVPLYNDNDLDREMRYEYQLKIKGLPSQFIRAVRPSRSTEVRDKKNEHDVQFLYLDDEEDLHLRTALLLRKWYRTKNLSVAYNVNRIALPPAEAIGRPEHRNVLKFLVDAASELYGIDFEEVPRDFYDHIVREQTESNSDIGNLYLYLSGAKIHDAEELYELLGSYHGAEPLPLPLQVAAWYQAYGHLTRGREEGSTLSSSFKIPSTRYLDSLVNAVFGATDSHLMAEQREKIEYIICGNPEWSQLYRHDLPPGYIGEPPMYIPTTASLSNNPVTGRKIHAKIKQEELPKNLEHLTGANSLSLADDSTLEAAKEVYLAAKEFHGRIAEVLPLTVSFRRDKYVTAYLMKLLQEADIDPYSLYFYPYRDALVLWPHIDKLEGVADKLLEWMAIPRAGINEVAETVSAEQEQESLRLAFIEQYLEEIMGFAAVDLSNMTNEDMMESIGGTEGLDDYIAKATESVHQTEPEK